MSSCKQCASFAHVHNCDNHVFRKSGISRDTDAMLIFSVRTRIWSGLLFLMSLRASELLLLLNCKYFVLEFVMNVDAARSSSVVSSHSETFSSSGESLDELHRNILQGGEVLGYQFEPRRDSNHANGESADIEDDQNMSSDEDESVARLGNLAW